MIIVFFKSRSYSNSLWPNGPKPYFCGVKKEISENFFENATNLNEEIIQSQLVLLYFSFLFLKEFWINDVWYMSHFYKCHFCDEIC